METNMNIKTSTLAVAVAAVMGLGLAGQAAASVYASSGLEVQNVSVFITEDLVNPSPNVTINSFQFTATNTATLNGVNAPTQSATCGGTPGTPPAGNDCNIAIPRLDPNPANAPGSSVSRSNNDFSFFGPGTDQYANSDSVITTSELTLDGSSNTQQIAESELQSGNSASSNAEIKSSTGFTFNFTISGAGTDALVLQFDADPSLMAEIMQGGNFLNGNAQANVNASFTLTQDLTGDAVSWSPQGSANNDCTVDAGLAPITCGELADGADLNRNLSVSSNGSSAQFSRAAGLSAFGIAINGLTNGDWTLAFNTLTSTSVRQTIPEPGALALLGIGLAGMGAVSLRKKKSKAKA